MTSIGCPPSTKVHNITVVNSYNYLAVVNSYDNNKSTTDIFTISVPSTGDLGCIFGTSFGSPGWYPMLFCPVMSVIIPILSGDMLTCCGGEIFTCWGGDIFTCWGDIVNICCDMFMWCGDMLTLGGDILLLWVDWLECDGDMPICCGDILCGGDRFLGGMWCMTDIFILMFLFSGIRSSKAFWNSKITMIVVIC